MGAEEIFDQAGEDILEYLGQDAIYNPSAGDPVSLKVNLDHENLLSPDDFNAQTWQPGITIEALLTYLGKEPDLGETFEVDSVVYTVAAIIENDGRFCKVEVKE